MKAPWWLCFGWHPRSLICAADLWGHHLIARLPERWHDPAMAVLDPICERHDRHIMEGIGR